MRTKLVLAAAILAAGLASSMAQNVYSLNVVGYVNQPVVANQWYLWGNPLDAGTNTTAVALAGLSGNKDDWNNALVYTFAGGAFGNADTYVGLGVDQWIPGTLNVAPGTGFFFFAPTNGTVTFVGNVVTTNTFALTGGAWNLVSSAFPSTNSLVNMGLVGGNNDFVYRYNNGYNNGDTFISPVGWIGTGDTNGPVLNVGEAVFYQNANATVNWVKSFTIQ